MTRIVAEPIYHVVTPSPADPRATACGLSDQVFAVSLREARTATDLRLCAVCRTNLRIPYPTPKETTQ